MNILKDDSSIFNNKEDLAIVLEYLGLYINITRPLDFYEILELLALHEIYVTNIDLLISEYEKILDKLEEKRRKKIDRVFSFINCKDLEDFKNYVRREAELGYKRSELKERAINAGWNINKVKKCISLRDIIIKRNRNFLHLLREKIDDTNYKVEVVYT